VKCEVEKVIRQQGRLRRAKTERKKGMGKKYRRKEGSRLRYIGEKTGRAMKIGWTNKMHGKGTRKKEAKLKFESSKER
jgi:hypothetical protein